MVLLICTILSSSKYPGLTTTMTLSDAVNALSVSQERVGGQSIITKSYACLIGSSLLFNRASRWSIAEVRVISVLESKICEGTMERFGTLVCCTGKGFSSRMV